MSIGLLDDLQTGNYDVAVFLTYTLNLRFFEALVLPRLRRMGVKRVGILTDEKGYADSFQDPLIQNECGLAYSVGVVRLPRGNIQHAKLLWLQGRDYVSYVGSHNLTMPGYNDQLEVTSRLSSTDPGHIQALQQIYRVLSQIVPASFSHVWKYVTPPQQTSVASSVIFMSNLDTPLSSQLGSHIRTASELRVVTPFLDTHALRDLASSVQAQRVILDVPCEGADIPLIDAVYSIPSLNARRLTSKRRLHAKAYEFKTSETDWLAIGSANCTQAALAKSVSEGGNLEFLVLIRDASLPIDAVEFADTTDYLTCTGRSWDDGRVPANPLVIEDAQYRKGRLEVTWSVRPGVTVEAVELSAGDAFVPCFGSPTNLELSSPPRVVTIRGTLGMETCVRQAWVTRPDRLEDQVAEVQAQRIANYLASEDPIHHCEGISAFFDQILKELFQGDGQVPSRITVSSGIDHELRPIKNFVEIFEFSHDPQEILANAHELLLGHVRYDPLAVLRSLIARNAALPPQHMQDDPDELARHEKSKRKSQVRISDSLAHHLEQLSKRERKWEGASTATIVRCLRMTFSACVLVWYNVSEREASDQTKERTAESFVALLARLQVMPLSKTRFKTFK